MISDVTHFTLEEGGGWHSWPFRPEVKPSNPDLSVLRDRKSVTWRGRAGDGVKIKFHALRFSDGRQWDCINGFRKVTLPWQL